MTAQTRTRSRGRARPVTLTLPSAPTLAALEEGFADVQFAMSVIRAARTLRSVNWGQLPADGLAAAREWLQDLWSLLHRSQTVQDGVLRAEFQALRSWKDVARHTADHLQGSAYASWGHRGPIYEETKALLKPLVALQQLGFLTTQGQPATCVTDAIDNHGRRMEHRQRGYLEGIMRQKYLVRFVKYLDTKRASVGYEIVTASGDRFSSGHAFPPNRERRVSASGTPQSPWYLDTRPLQEFEPLRHRRLRRGAADARHQVAIIQELNPRLAKKLAPQFTVYACVFGLKACRRPADVLRVVLNFFRAHVPARERAGHGHVETLYGNLRLLRDRAKAIAPPRKASGRTPRGEQRRRFEHVFEKSVRARAKLKDTALKLPPTW
jgi:hypothetical protein